MTTTHPSNVTALPAMQERPLVSDRMAAFMAEELLPMMAGSWPASANYLDANARGVVLAWGGVLRGFTPAQIREVVLDMAVDIERQFAPRPAEVRAEILRRLPPEPRQLLFSIGACEMEATVIVLKRDGEVTRDAVKTEMERIITERRDRGYTITGGDSGMFNQDVIAAVKVAKFCRVVVYPAVRGWSGERVQLEVAEELSALGHTDYRRGAGHWLVIDMAPERVAVEVERLRYGVVQVFLYRRRAP